MSRLGGPRRLNHASTKPPMIAKPMKNPRATQADACCPPPSRFEVGAAVDCSAAADGVPVSVATAAGVLVALAAAAEAVPLSENCAC